MVCDKVGFLHNGIIVKEINLNSSDSSAECYEITFALSEPINHELLNNTFKKWPCFLDGNNLIITADDDNKAVQNEILFNLSQLPYKVIKLAKRKTHDLERVMEEILAE